MFLSHLSIWLLSHHSVKSCWTFSPLFHGCPGHSTLLLVMTFFWCPRLLFSWSDNCAVVLLEGLLQVRGHSVSSFFRPFPVLLTLNLHQNLLFVTWNYFLGFLFVSPVSDSRVESLTGETTADWWCCSALLPEVVKSACVGVGRK